MTGDINEFLMKDVDAQDYVRAIQQETFARLNCMRIGLINQILPNNEVQCLITNKKLMGINKDGTQIVRDYPPIYARLWYMGSGANGIDYPLTVGTPCLLLFNDREFESFFATGQVSPLSDLRTHSFNDCICVPLFYAALTEEGQHNGNFNIKSNGVLNISGSTINLTAETINLNGSDTININAPNVMINGIKWEDHKHGNGNQGQNTTGVVV